jgi:hypothetical protein
MRELWVRFLATPALCAALACIPYIGVCARWVCSRTRCARRTRVKLDPSQGLDTEILSLSVFSVVPRAFQGQEHALLCPLTAL